MLELFWQNVTITSGDMERLFGISQRTTHNLLGAWVDDGFVAVADPAKKPRKYSVGTRFAAILGFRQVTNCEWTFHRRWNGRISTYRNNKEP